jgi:hypothetical protein
MLGPLLSKSFGQFGHALGRAAQVGAAADTTGGSAIVVALVGMFLSAFIGAVAIPWIALYANVERAEPIAATPEPAPAPTSDKAFVVHDGVVTLQPGQPGGTWWYLRAGDTVEIALAQAAGVATPAAADAVGAWLTPREGTHAGAAAFDIPADGWFLLGAWPTGPVGAQLPIQLTVPEHAHAAPAQQVA